jgi:ribosomal protein S18 acetylase RimI-like enzyme
MFHTYYKLIPTLIPKLKMLQNACAILDGMEIPLYFHYLEQRREMPFWVYENEKGEWLGFINAFYFYDAGCEVALLVHPKYRRQGLSKALIRAMLTKIPQAHIHSFYFSTPKTGAVKFLQDKGFKFQHSEFCLCFDPQETLKISNPPAILKANYEHLEDLVAIEKACFDEAETIYRFMILLKDPQYHLWVFEKNNKTIGKVHLREDADRLTLSNLAVLPLFQGQGIGKMLVQRCQHYAQAIEKPLYLDVETNNEKALELYQRLGFKMHQAIDYYLIELDPLKAYCCADEHTS